MSETLGLVGRRPPSALAPFRARDSDGWPTGAQIVQPCDLLLAKRHAAGACHAASLPRSRLTGSYLQWLSSYAHSPAVGGAQARRPSSAASTSRSPIRTTIIGECVQVATGIGTEDASALSVLANPYPLAALTFADLLTVRSHAVSGGSLHRGRPRRGDRSRRVKGVKPALLAVGIDTLAGAIVPGGLGEVERSSPRHRAQSSQQKSLGASQTRPLGQRGRPARPGERRARHSVRTAGMAGRVKSSTARSCVQDGSSEHWLGARPRLPRLPRLGGKI